MLSRGGKIALCVFALALLLPAAAVAKNKVYGGKADIGGKIAFDVKVSKKGKPKEISEIRFEGIPATCDITGPGVPLNARIPAGLSVDKKGKFEFELTDKYGNKNSIKGKFSGRRAKFANGTFVYANHYPADDKYPEENCSTGPAKFDLKAGGPDVNPSVPRGVLR